MTDSAPARRLDDWRIAAAWFSLASSVVLAALAPTQHLWLAFAALAAATTFAWILTPRSAPLRLYIVALFLAFVIFPLLAGEPLTTVGPVVSLLAVWLLAWAFGAHLASKRPTPALDVRAHGRPWSILPFFAFGVVGLVVQILDVASGANLLSSQLSGQSELGPTAILRAAAPASLAVAFWLARLTSDSPTWPSATTAAVAVQATLLLFSGFRSSAPMYLVTLWLTGTPYAGRGLKVRSIRRHKQRRLIPLITAAVLLLALVQFASFRRAEIAAGHGVSHAGTRTFSFDDPLAFAERFNYARYVDAAIDREPRFVTPNPSSPTKQLTALVPRALWPDKPIIDYGRDIAYYYFDLPRQYRSSETITFIGDLYVMGGPASIPAVGVGVGIVFSVLLLKRRGIATGPNIVGTYLAMTILVKFELPLILNAVDAIRIGLILLVLGAAASLCRSARPRSASYQLPT